MITILHTTGYPTVTRDGNRLTFKTRFDLALLLYLALAPGVHGRDTLANLLWPAADRERGLNALRSTLSRLRSDYGQWLRIDRATVALIPDGQFVIDSEGYAPIGDGLRISLQYDAWLYSVMASPDTVRPLPYWWHGKERTEVSGVADFCRNELDRLVYRGDNIRRLETRYSDIFCAFLSATDYGDQLALASTLFYFSLAGHHVQQSYTALHNRQSENEALEVGRRFAMIVISDQSAASCNYEKELDAIYSIAHGNSDPFLQACQSVADSIVALRRSNAARASESCQIALLHEAILASRYHQRLLLHSAKCCAYAGQRRAATAYLSQARALIMQNRSYYLLERADAIARLIDHA